MPDYGTLNGQPVGPDLPPPVPCERCGHPVWLGQGVVAFKKAPSFHVFPDRDLRLELRSRLWELSLLRCPAARGRSTRTRAPRSRSSLLAASKRPYDQG